MKVELGLTTYISYSDGHFKKQILVLVSFGQSSDCHSQTKEKVVFFS